MPLPDLVVYHKDRIKIEEYLIGVPDLIVEVLYPGDPVYEEAIKLHACAHAGLSEYAVIDTKARTLRYYRLIELGKFTDAKGVQGRRECHVRGCTNDLRAYRKVIWGCSGYYLVDFLSASKRSTACSAVQKRSHRSHSAVCFSFLVPAASD